MRDINVSDETNLIMTTQDGYTVHLGGAERMYAKVGTVRSVISSETTQPDRGRFRKPIPGEATYRRAEGDI